jgi:hypothetical protein
MSRSLGGEDSISARAALVSSSTSSMTGRCASLSTLPVSTDSAVLFSSTGGETFRRRGLVVFLGTSASISVIQQFPRSRTQVQANIFRQIPQDDADPN